MSKEPAIDLGISSIPTFIFYDETLSETARWVERPAIVARALTKSPRETRGQIVRDYLALKYHHETCARC